MTGILAVIAGSGARTVVFNPAGGATSGSPVALVEEGTLSATISIECSEVATWTYTGGGNPGSYVSIGSGQSSAVITFQLMTEFNQEADFWNVSGTAGGVTQHWTVSLLVFGFQ
jgi:hypothetical protein